MTCRGGDLDDLLVKSSLMASHGVTFLLARQVLSYILEIVFTRASPAFDNLFMGCVFNINTVHKTVEKLTFQAFY